MSKSGETVPKSKLNSIELLADAILGILDILDKLNDNIKELNDRLIGDGK